MIASRMVTARTKIAAGLRAQHGERVDADRAAAVLLTLMPGYLHARVMIGDLTPERYVAGLRELIELADET